MPGCPTYLDRSGQGFNMLAVGADEGCLNSFLSPCHTSFLFTSLWETARYRLKSVKLKINQPTYLMSARTCGHLYSCPLSVCFVCNLKQKLGKVDTT